MLSQSCPSGEKIKRSNASLKDIRCDPIFQNLLHSNNTQDYLGTQDITELRKMKQALNNQICLFVFWEFINEFWTDFDQSLPFLNKDGEIKILSPEVAIPLFPIDEKITQVMTPRLIPHIDTQTKKRIVGEYLWAFTQMLIDYFDNKINELQKSDIRDIQNVFLILDTYISEYFTDISKWFLEITWETKFLFPNTHLSEFLSFITEFQGNLSLQQIEKFLKLQTREKLKQSKSNDGAMKYNCWATYLCPQDQVYKILEWDLMLPWEIIFGKVMPDIQGCPFAASQVWEENAFQLTFKMFNNFYIQIIKHLDSQWVSLHN